MRRAFRILFVLFTVVGMLLPATVAFGADPEFFTSNLRFGSRGEGVRRLQTFLKQFPNIYPEGLVTGYFWRFTRAAVQRLQTNYHLPVTGVVDAGTRVVLNDISARLAAPTETAAPPPPPPVVSDGIGAPPAVVTPVPRTPYFTFSWRPSTRLTGEITVGTPAPPPIVVVGGTRTILAESGAAARLFDLYKIALVDGEVPWNEERATLFYEMLRRLPDTQFHWGDYKPWRITLTEAPLSGDIEITGSSTAPVRIARVSIAAFTRANPTLEAFASGNADRVFYSNRLFRAVLKIFYSDPYLLKEVFTRRYGIDIGVVEPVDEFQEFSIDELQYLATVFEDLPSGFRNIPGLDKIVRRRTGLRNPLNPEAPAIAWVDGGYIEFMDNAWSSGSADYIERLIAHEMAHFLWHKVFTGETHTQFMQLSGWVSIGPLTWTHRTTTNFVSAHAASINPDEDFAETLSYYIYAPDHVRTIAADKYAFVKDVIDGYEYVLLVDQQFTFQVFNLEPDLTFPGKIMGIDTEVSKLESGDNHVVVTLHLSSALGDGAERAYMRLVSPTGTYTDQYFSPIDGNKFMLRADFTVTKYAAYGYWVPTGITVEDQVDNRRYESQEQFGWQLFIDNPEEDLMPPEADLSGLTIERTTSEGDPALRVTIPVRDEHTDGIHGASTLLHKVSGQGEFVYGAYDAATGRLTFLFTIRKYKASGAWTFHAFSVSDIAGNWIQYDLKDLARTIEVVTPSPDFVKPSLDVSAISITAVPTVPRAPNGETDVTIRYRARDDNAGLGLVSYTLLKPNGQVLFDYHYHDNFYTPYFVGAAPTEWQPYTIQIRLPPGSIPGIWALKEIVLKDKADNILTSNFVEVGIVKRFDVY